MRKKKYECLLEDYPEFISLNQMCRICKIAKRSGLYLLQNKIVPAIDTGQKTWRYKIAVANVITYLRRREQWGSMIPPGAVNSRGRHQANPRRSFSSIVLQGEGRLISEYFASIYAEYPDILSVVELAEMTGLHKKTLLKLLKKGEIGSFRDGIKYAVPKSYVLDFVCTMQYIEAKSNSAQFIKVLVGYETWKSTKK